MSEVVRLVPNEISADFRFDPDAVLESMKGKPFAALLIIAQLEDNEMLIEGNCNAGEAMVLMELAKDEIVHGADK